MKKLIWILFITLFIFCGCTEKNNKNDLYQSVIQKDKIIVAVSLDAKPFAYKDSDGQIKGLEIDLAKEIAERLLGGKDKIVFKNITPQERINIAMSGGADMVISTMTITPQRKKLIEFSEPYFIAGQVICVRRNSKISSLDDLINKRIIVILGTTGEKNIKEFAPNALIQGYSDTIEAISAFKNKSGDAITTDDSLLQGLVIENSDYIILPKKLTKEPYGIAFKKSKQTNVFRSTVNKILYDIKLDGTLEAIKNKWITN